MTGELAQSSRSKRVTTRVMATVLRSLAEIGAAIKDFFRASHSTSAGKGETEAVATSQIAAHAEVDADAGISSVSRNEPDQHEVERRRNLVRTLFNDFWRGEDQKPASFTARLDQAEDYLNQRLAANRETWRLDAESRVILGLPPRLRSD